MITLKGIGKNFWNKGKKLEILKNISLEINPSEIIRINGKNASGKTTLMRIISGQLQPDLGTINYNNSLKNNIFLASNNTRSFFFRLTVKDNLKFFFSIQNPNNHGFRKALEFLEEMRCTQILEKRFSNISSGQKKIVILSRALCFDPKIILIDELFSEVDAAKKHKIAQFFHHLITRYEKSLIYTTHEETALLNEGKSFKLLNQELVSA